MKTEAEIRVRPVRRPRSELKELVLQGAVEILQATELVLSLESLSYVRVFEHLKETQGVTITRGSVHERIWSSVEEFRLDALLHALEEPVSFVYDAMGEIVAAAISTVDTTTLQGRREAVIRIHRDAMPLYETIDHLGERWKLLGLQILASMPKHEGGPAAELAQRLENYDRFWQDSYIAQFAGVFDQLQLRVRPELGIDQDTALRTLVQWATDLSVGQRIFDGGTGTPRPDVLVGVEGHPAEEWSSFGLACYALLQHLFTDE